MHALIDLTCNKVKPSNGLKRIKNSSWSSPMDIVVCFEN